MDFYEILLEIMKEKSLKIPDVARETGLSDSTIRSIINRKTKNVTLEVAFKISKGLGVSLEKLNGENVKEEMSKEENIMIGKYRSLDIKGKHTVNTVLDMEYTRCKDEDTLPLAAHHKEDIVATEEEVKHDLDIMKDGREW